MMLRFDLWLKEHNLTLEQWNEGKRFTSFTSNSEDLMSRERDIDELVAKNPHLAFLKDHKPTAEDLTFSVIEVPESVYNQIEQELSEPPKPNPGLERLFNND